MQKILAVVVIAVTPILCLAQDRTAEVGRTFRELRAASNKHDVPALERLLVDNFTFVTRDGHLFSRDEYLKRQKQGMMLAGGKTEILKTRIYGDSAVVIDRYTDTSAKGTLTIVGTYILVRQDGVWKWASFHGSREGATDQ